ncbi:hypothetical protein [Niabella aurantiaca]|uniref:hypothetical protein n=1 Tax=Niabella aurantiaca TaxID=379900 RepID=UPI000378EE5D|nr:hypothetical protein [Niabella aurantiaca]
MTLDLTNFAFTDAGGKKRVVLTDAQHHQFIANTVCFNVKDIGLFEKMRALYNNGSVELTDTEKDAVLSVIKDKLSPFLAYQFTNFINGSM